jgi:hypothetical protein
MKQRFTALSFESVKFIDLFNDWWTNQGSHTRSKFQYRTPRVIARFDKKKAREITPDAMRDFSETCERKVLQHRASTSAVPSSAVSSTMPFGSRNTTRTP